jgi:metal-responsive CopG/Arc/MetJ family transcriptional regulator
MAAKAKRTVSPRPEPETVRSSIGFPSEVYKALEDIAKEKKVSVAWIVRDAAEQYVARRWPLLSTSPEQPAAPGE